MLPCSMNLCPEVGETAFIDQRAVAAGNKCMHHHQHDISLFWLLQENYSLHSGGGIFERCPNISSNRTCTLVVLTFMSPLNNTLQLANGTVLHLRYVDASCKLILWFKLKSPNQCLPVSVLTELWRHLKCKSPKRMCTLHCFEKQSNKKWIKFQQTLISVSSWMAWSISRMNQQLPSYTVDTAARKETGIQCRTNSVTMQGLPQPISDSSS